MHLAMNAEATRLAAAKELLDRAYGKSRQANTGLDVPGINAGNGGNGLLDITVNQGIGALSISTEDDVTGGASGIHALIIMCICNLLGSTDMMVTTASVSGGVHGIHADNGGTGALAVSVSGSVSGVSGDGIRMETRPDQYTSIALYLGAAVSL